MAIVSLQFALLVAVALAVHHLLPPRAQNAWLLLVSYAFYCFSAWRFFPVLAALTVANFAIAGRLAPGSCRRTAWLWAGIGANAAALAGLRYAYREEPFAGPFAVLGISFYSLQAMSYLFDAASGRLKQRGSLGDVALYLAYFPKLVAGPIERAHAFFPQLAQRRAVDDQVVARALTLIAIGLTRKLVVADPLAALLPAPAFSSPGGYGALVLAGALLGYVFSLYNDFAGYTNIACGVSSLFGIELSPNFAQPFFARSFTEFWNRWHITLSMWLRDYVYLPLSRAVLRRSPGLHNLPNLILPPMAAMFISGLWHGTDWHMLLWGSLHGAYLVVERVVSLLRPPVPMQRRPLRRQVAAACLVFTLGVLTFAAFRMDVGVAIPFWRDLFRGVAGSWPDPRLLLYMVPSLWLDWLQYRGGDETAAFLRWSRARRAALLAAAMLLWFLMTRGQAGTPFVYEGF